VVFGDTPFGVRIGSILLSFAASWFVWRSAVILLGNEKAGGLACLLFNLTLMTTVETMAATPDAPSVATAAAYMWTLAKVVETRDRRWWLAAGVAAGLGLLSKLSALFLGLGTLVWLLASPPMRRWLTSFWPYLAGALAFAIFAPDLWWNAEHGWATFAFQFGRIDSGHFTLRYIVEFIGAQLVLASPFILVLGVMGLAASKWRDDRRALIAGLLWPCIAYFFLHSLHARVQGNWPCFVYPMLAVAAADAMLRTDWARWRAPLAHWSARLAVPVAAVMLLAGYAQALVGVIPFGRKDPLARLLAVGLPQVTHDVEKLRVASGAGAILTTDYATAGWFAFYGSSATPVVDIGEDYRWASAPAATAALFKMPALYVVEVRHDHRALIAEHFSDVTEIARIDRKREGVPIAHYVIYRVDGLKGPPPGRVP